MTVQKILVPYNFTQLDQKAIDFVINAFVQLKEVEVTLFHAYTDIPDIETDMSSITSKLKSSMNYLAQKIQEQEAELNNVQQRLLRSGFAGDCLYHIFRPRKKDIAGEIIDLVMQKKFNIIVLNRKHARATRFFTGSVSNKVVTGLKGSTVCIVS